MKCVIGNLKRSASKDVFELGSRYVIINFVTDFITEPLIHMKNVYIQQFNMFPEVFKLFKISLWYRKGYLDDASSYRLISMIAVVAKIFQIVLKIRLFLK